LLHEEEGTAFPLIMRLGSSRLEGAALVIWNTVGEAIHSLTGPVGQPFASCVGGQRFVSRDAQTRNGTGGGGVLLMLSRYINDPDMILSLTLQPFSGCFTRLCADNVKSQLDRISLVSPGIKPGYIVFPSHKNNVHI
jgi:hypothetical protein